MAASGYTPIILFNSTTTGNTPTTSNLAVGELAINVTDGKLFFNQSGTIKVLANATYATSVSTISFGTTGLTPSTATNGVVAVAGTLITSNGGTGLSSYTAGDLSYYASGTALTKLAIGTNGYILQSTGSAPSWVAASTVVGGAAGSNTQVQFNNSGALGASANLTWNGTTFTASNLATPGVVQFSTNAAQAAGSIAKNATYGLTYFGITGSSYDATLLNNVGNVALGVTTGTTNVVMPADATISGLTVGRGAGAVATNTAVGASALAANTSGTGNVAFGNSALGTNITGSYQVAVGAGALYTSKAGPNTAVGYYALNANNTGVNNVAVGNGAMQSNTGGYNNVAMGGSALSTNLNGIANTAIGHNSLLNVTNSYNTALGMYSGTNMGNTTYNTAIGYTALYTQTTGSSNTAVGHNAGYTTNGNYNTYVGYQAGNLDAAVGATFNTYIGASSGASMTTGNNNTILGPYTGNANGWDIRATNGNIVLSVNGQPSLGMASTNGWYFSANVYNSPMGTITSGKGTSYLQTSTSGSISIVDTGIYAGTPGIGYAISSYAGGTYDCYLVANPNAGGASYSMPIYGQIMTNTGYDGSNVRDYITFVTIASFPPNSVPTLTVTAVFNIGGTEYTNVPSGTTNAQIRLKISGFNPSYVGAGAVYRIIAR